ncbi:MAG: hypothetical protein ACK5MZ_08625 [Aestuariibaculum sp.]
MGYCLENNRRFLSVVLYCFLMFSCNNNKDATIKTKIDTEKYNMYLHSEMALLMEQMYAHNMKLKQEISEGKVPVEFPVDFLKIHSAQLTTPTDRNDTFESFSELFIEAEMAIYDPRATGNIKDRYNKAINMCLSCHEQVCAGPIPRIKKLLIK